MQLNVENGVAMFRIFLFESHLHVILRLYAMRNELKTKAIVLYSYMDVGCGPLSEEMWGNEKSCEVTQLITVSFFPLLLQGVWVAEGQRRKKPPEEKDWWSYKMFGNVAFYHRLNMPSARGCCITTKQVYYFRYTLCTASFEKLLMQRMLAIWQIVYRLWSNVFLLMANFVSKRSKKLHFFNQICNIVAYIFNSIHSISFKMIIVDSLAKYWMYFTKRKK